MRKLIVVGLLILASKGTYCQTAGQARSFLDDIYAWDTKVDADDPLADSKVYTPSLIKLFQEDQGRAGKGYVGKLDFDPLCSCQDPGGVVATIKTLSMTGNRSGQSTVSLRYPDGKKAELTFDLLWTLAGWRINDTHSANIPSLRRFLKSGSGS